MDMGVWDVLLTVQGEEERGCRGCCAVSLGQVINSPVLIGKFHFRCLPGRFSDPAYGTVMTVHGNLTTVPFQQSSLSIPFRSNAVVH